MQVYVVCFVYRWCKTYVASPPSVGVIPAPRVSAGLGNKPRAMAAVHPSQCVHNPSQRENVRCVIRDRGVLSSILVSGTDDLPSAKPLTTARISSHRTWLLASPTFSHLKMEGGG